MLSTSRHLFICVLPILVDRPSHAKRVKQSNRHDLHIWLFPHDFALVVVTGSEIAGEAAAGLAAAYIVLGANKAVSATTLSSYLTHSEQLYTLATTYQGSYQTLTNDPCLKQLGVRAKRCSNPYDLLRRLVDCRPAMALYANHISNHSSEACRTVSCQACPADMQFLAGDRHQVASPAQRVLGMHVAHLCWTLLHGQSLMSTPSWLGSQMLYASTGYVDELAWAAAWLFKATGNQQYLTDAKTYYAKVLRWQSWLHKHK